MDKITEVNKPQQLDWKGRVEQELSDLRERADKLKAFISKPKPDFMEDDAWDLLLLQHDTMLKYIEILEKRLSLS